MTVVVVVVAIAAGAASTSSVFMPSLKIGDLALRKKSQNCHTLPVSTKRKTQEEKREKMYRDLLRYGDGIFKANNLPHL